LRFSLRIEEAKRSKKKQKEPHLALKEVKEKTTLPGLLSCAFYFGV
jgi:hypothetical protein